MTPALEIDIDGRTYSAVPESWVAAGHHHQPDSGAARRFATLAAVDDGEVIVRYVHPVNSGVVEVAFVGVGVDTGMLPRPLVQEHIDWPKSITRDPWADATEAGSVRMGERDLLWELHGDWLEERTAYEQDAELVADGGWHADQTETIWCDECDGERDHSLVGWNPVGRPLWQCDACETRQVGPDRGHGRAGQGGAPFAADGGDDRV